MENKSGSEMKTNYYTFFKPGVENSSNLTPRVRQCESVMYGEKILKSNYRFGKKNKFIQKAVKSFEKKGTKGAFTRWCKSKGYPKVTTACIKAGKRSKSKLTRKRAVFAENIRSRYSFGKSSGSLKSINSDIRYLN